MNRDVITCEECIHYNLVERWGDNFNHPDVYKCTRWERIVEASDYCSKAIKAYPCRSCKYCRSLAQSNDKKELDLKYVCVRERLVYYTDPGYSCSYYEKGEEINNESTNN